MTRERIIDQRGSDQEHAEWMQRGWQRGYAKGFGDVAVIAARREAALREALRRFVVAAEELDPAMDEARALLSEVPQ